MQTMKHVNVTSWPLSDGLSHEVECIGFTSLDASFLPDPTPVA